MKFFNLIWILTAFVYAFEQEDHEIFDIQDSLKSLFGADSTFYSVLEVTKDATEKQITKSYRKKSLQYHPDKNTTPEAAKLYKLLTSVQAILKNPELKKKYDGHLERGFPVWRGSGYYYSHFEPGFLFVIFFCLAMISVAQYIIEWVYYFQSTQQEPVQVPVKTYTQLKKELKKQGQTLSKKEFKKTGSVEQLPVLEIEKPKILDTLIFKIPFYIINLVQKKVKSE